MSAANVTPIDMEAATRGMIYEKSVRVPTRDGSYVSINIFRPEGQDQVPALLCASVYGKDMHTQHLFPEIWGNILQQLPHLKAHSTLSLHTHETNDPEVWVPWGYACVRMDVPGAGKSPGKLDCFSGAERRAIHDVIEWLAAQPWCNGKVGMTGISYFAMVQWRVAAEQPPHLAAICPWEGVADFYRDWNRHGGMLNTLLPAWYPMSAVPLQHGFTRSHLRDLDDGGPIGGPDDLSDEALRANRVDFLAEIRKRELDDEWWRDHSADLTKIEVPFLSAGNWGGNCHHLRGNVEAFVQAPAKQKWLEMHAGNHRDEYYLPRGEQLMKDFFDHFLKGVDNGFDRRPPLILKIRRADDTLFERAEHEWPLARTQWTKFYLDADDGSLGAVAPAGAGAVTFSAGGDGVGFQTPAFDAETEITGPMAAKLFVSSSSDDADLFLIVRVIKPDGTEAYFDGSADPAVPFAQGWLRASHRKLDPARSLPYRPWHAHDEIQKLTPGHVYELDIEIWPSCVVMPAGYRIELRVQGKDFIRKLENRPAYYVELGRRMSEAAGDGADRSGINSGSGSFLHTDVVDRPPERLSDAYTIHAGGEYRSYLMLPIVPGA